MGVTSVNISCGADASAAGAAFLYRLHVSECFLLWFRHCCLLQFTLLLVLQVLGLRLAYRSRPCSRACDLELEHHILCVVPCGGADSLAQFWWVYIFLFRRNVTLRCGRFNFFIRQHLHRSVIPVETPSTRCGRIRRWYCVENLLKMKLRGTHC